MYWQDIYNSPDATVRLHDHWAFACSQKRLPTEQHVHVENALMEVRTVFQVCKQFFII